MKLAHRVRTGIALVAVGAVVTGGAATAAPDADRQAQHLRLGSAAKGTGSELVTVAPVKSVRARTIDGKLPDGAQYVIDVPRRWNGTLLLYSHGYNGGPENPAVNVGDPDGRLKPALLERGFALAGGSYPGLGWQTPVAVQSQMMLLRTFRQQVEKPRRVIAWGHSMGGEITQLLAERYPNRIDGAVPMCPQVAGEVPWLNAYLDGAYTMKTLLDPAGDVELVGITDAGAAAAYWANLATEAQQRPAGRARLALAAAFTTLPKWTDPQSAQPGPTDYPAQQEQQFRALTTSFIAFQVFVRQDMERRVGGAFSWNAGVDYRQLFRRLDPRYRAQVRSLYARSSLDLDADLQQLQEGPRVEPTDPTAIAQANTDAQRGTIEIPVLTMHTIGDGIVFPSLQPVLARRVERHGAGSLLRQTWVKAAGHCTFTASESLAALRTMVRRVRSDDWPRTGPEAMNDRADRTRLGDARFTRHRAPTLPRPNLWPPKRLLEAD